jgi:hypothetical protein
MKRKMVEVKVEVRPRHSSKAKKEEALHEKYEGKETKSFKTVEHHLAMAKKHHEQAMHHNEMAKKAKEHHKHKDGKSHETKHERNKVSKVMHEFKEGELHSSSKKGPVVTNPKQALAIAMSESGLSRKKKHKR